MSSNSQSLCYVSEYCPLYRLFRLSKICNFIQSTQYYYCPKQQHPLLAMIRMSCRHLVPEFLLRVGLLPLTVLCDVKSSALHTDLSISYNAYMTRHVSIRVIYTDLASVSNRCQKSILVLPA